MNNLIAQTGRPIGTPFEGFGNLGTPGSQAPTLFARFISVIIGLMTVIAAIWFIFLLISGAIGIMTSGGDKMALENARKRMTTGVIGFAIVILAMFVMDFIANMLGVEGILDIESVINRLSP